MVLQTIFFLTSAVLVGKHFGTLLFGVLVKKTIPVKFLEFVFCGTRSSKPDYILI